MMSFHLPRNPKVCTSKYVSTAAVSRISNKDIQLQTQSSHDAHIDSHFEAFHSSVLIVYPRFFKIDVVLRSVNTRLNNHPAHNVTIDTASDVACISVKFEQPHPSLKYTEKLRVPPAVINLCSADASPLKRLVRSDQLKRYHSGCRVAGIALLEAIIHAD